MGLKAWASRESFDWILHIFRALQESDGELDQEAFVKLIKIGCMKAMRTKGRKEKREHHTWMDLGFAICGGISFALWYAI
eukprot:SAG31_NODE_20788_length_565_cov_1.081545_2_plen_79_part_01